MRATFALNIARTFLARMPYRISEGERQNNGHAAYQHIENRHSVRIRNFKKKGSNHISPRNSLCCAA